MIERIIVTGSGGQGIMILGKVLAEAAMHSGLYVSWLPAYGAEVRGGAAYCMVTISSQEISSPYIQQADTLIAMNGLSLRKFMPLLKKNGLLINNSSISGEIKNAAVKIKNCPCTEIAIGLNNIRVANIVAVGCYLAAKKQLALKTVYRVIQDMAPAGAQELIEINQKALQSGLTWEP